jgi:hypothetical protein
MPCNFVKGFMKYSEDSMKIVNFPQSQYQSVGASGDCPHCLTKSYFSPLATHQEQIPASGVVTIVSAARCESCKNFILVIGLKNAGTAEFNLMAAYPMGKPKDDVDASVPKQIADDFSEAIRCRWIDANRAAVVMCRRAIQASAIALDAKGDQLVRQIENLFKAGKITEPLKDFAHEVRLTGNDGAHPDKDGLKDVTEKDADDMIEFTREFLHHVYVMPAKLESRRPKPIATPGANAYTLIFHFEVCAWPDPAHVRMGRLPRALVPRFAFSTAKQLLQQD